MPLKNSLARHPLNTVNSKLSELSKNIEQVLVTLADKFSVTTLKINNKC